MTEPTEAQVEAGAKAVAEWRYAGERDWDDLSDNKQDVLIEESRVCLTAALAVAPMTVDDSLEQVTKDIEARIWEWSALGLNQSAGVLPKYKASVTRKGLKAQPERGIVLVHWTWGQNDKTYTQTFECRGDTPLEALRQALAAMTAADGRED